ncbi:PPE family protein [Mycobacterium sp.]|uniref:PPE family protein n=1 Tax=Mycobacterium sp. TaxID=1785 RepID=UPI003F974A03
MDFGILPPEITSALIHSGPGAGSLVAASSVWQQLSFDLEESVGSYASVLSLLTADWRGPSSTAMAKAVEPYLAWLRTTAQQCEQVGSSVRAVVAAFELTHFTVVQPALVTANRTRLAWLVATNFFGINLPAIAETEAEYVAMWVNNSAAMFRYAETSASAVVLHQFSSPPAIVDPTGTAAQAAAVPAATTSTSAQSIIDQIGSFFTSILSTPGGFNPNTGWFGLANTWANQTIAAGGYPVNILGVLAQFATAKGFQSLGGDVAAGLAEGEASLAAAEARFANALGAAGWAEAPTAEVGVGVMVGKLVAPPGVVGLFSTESPVQLASAVSSLPSETPPWLGMPMTPMGVPPAAAGNRRREGRDYDNIEYGSELLGTVMQRPPSAG